MKKEGDKEREGRGRKIWSIRHSDERRELVDEVLVGRGEGGVEKDLQSLFDVFARTTTMRIP